MGKGAAAWLFSGSTFSFVFSFSKTVKSDPYGTCRRGPGEAGSLGIFQIGILFAIRHTTTEGSEFFALTATQTADGDNLSSPDVVVVVDVNGSHYMLLGLEYNWIKIKFPRQCNGIMPPMMRMGWWILGPTSARMRGFYSTFILFG